MKRATIAMAVLLGLAATTAAASGSDSAPRSAGTTAGETQRCRVPSTLASLDAALPNLARTIRAGGPVVIVALGSASTAGAGSSSPAASYPVILEEELSRRFPEATFRVINKGFAGQRALDMYRRIETEIVDERPSLVIWQTGVTDAVHDVGLERFRKILSKGIGKIRAADADVILMDHQYLSVTERYPQFQDYKSAMREVARASEAGLFRRYDVMKAWDEGGGFERGEWLSPEGRMVDAGYYCLAVTLADAIAASLAHSDVTAAKAEAH